MFVSAAATTSKSMSLVTALVFVAVPLIYFRYQRKSSQKGHGDENDSLSSIAGRRSSLKPPFPLVVREVLSKSRLAYLSTVDPDLASSHLSLMRFTYVNDPEDGEVIIMSTNRKTKKFEMLQNQRGVALLVHDFQQDGNDGVYSITLNGDCRIVDLPKKAEQYREAHLKHNPEYPQFIVGEDIAILCVHATSARICNVYDQVTKWDVAAES
jgi:general stress protein 26